MTTDVGILLPTRESMLYGDRSGDPRPLVELAVQAEEAGFDSVWAGDSLLARPRPEPLALLAGVATATRRVRLGTAVLLPVLRNPILLAHQVATLDRLSSGRVVLGVGAAGDNPDVRHEHEAVGAPWTTRASRMVEVVRRCQALWRGEDAETLLPSPHQVGGPPIWVGGSGARTLERTGRHFDGWFPTAASPEAFAAGFEKVRAAASAAGRDPDRLGAAAYLTVTIGEPAWAQAQVEHHLEAYYGVPFAVMSRFQGTYGGSAEGALAWLSRFVDAGVRHLVLRVGCEDVAAQLPLLADLLGDLRAREG